MLMLVHQNSSVRVGFISPSVWLEALRASSPSDASLKSGMPALLSQQPQEQKLVIVDHKMVRWTRQRGA